jgi:hypothetical protein
MVHGVILITNKHGPYFPKGLDFLNFQNIAKNLENVNKFTHQSEFWRDLRANKYQYSNNK